MKLTLNEILNKRNQVNQYIFYYTLALIVFVLPFSFAPPFGLVPYRFLVVLLVLNRLVAGYKADDKSKLLNIFTVTFLVFYLLHVVGIFYTENISYGLSQIEKKIPLLIMPLVIATSPKLEKYRINIVLNVFIISVLIASLICIGYAFYRNNLYSDAGVINWFYFTYYDLTDIINIQPNYLAIYVGFSILILLTYLLENPSNGHATNKVIATFIILYLCIFLLLLSGRTPILAIIIIVCTRLMYHFYKKQNLLKGIMITGGLSLVLIVILFQIPIIKERFLQTIGIEQNAEWINRFGDGSGVIPEVRSLKWQSSLNIIRDNWIFGVGTGDVEDALQLQYKSIGFKEGIKSKFNAHNQFLQTSIGLGIFGLISLLACLIIPALKAFKQADHLYLMFIAFFFTCCLTESTLERQFGIAFYSVFNSLLAFHFPTSKLQ